MIVGTKMRAKLYKNTNVHQIERVLSLPLGGEVMRKNVNKSTPNAQKLTVILFEIKNLFDILSWCGSI